MHANPENKTTPIHNNINKGTLRKMDRARIKK